MTSEALADLVKNRASMTYLLCKSRVMANFLLKFSNFRYHGNKNLSESKVTGIVELADPENHIIEPYITTLSYIQPKLWQIFC